MNDIQLKVNELDGLVDSWEADQRAIERLDRERNATSGSSPMANLGARYGMSKENQAWFRSSDREQAMREWDRIRRARSEHEARSSSIAQRIYPMIADFEKAMIPSLELQIRIARIIDRINPEKAIAFAHKGLGQFDDDRLRDLLANLLEKAGKTHELITLVVEDKFPDDLRPRITEQLLKAKEMREAVTLLSTEIKEYPRNRELLEYFDTVLVDALNSSIFETREAVVACLEKRQDIRAVELLNASFNREKEARLRLRALQALVSIQGSESSSTLWLGLADRSPEVRAYAAEAIGKLGGSSVVGGLMQVLQDERDDAVRKAIMSSLGIWDRQPRKWWEKLLGRRPWVRKEV